MAYINMPREDFPEIIRKQNIYIIYFSRKFAEDVEKLVIKPLEKQIKNISVVLKK